MRPSQYQSRQIAGIPVGVAADGRAVWGYGLAARGMVRASRGESYLILFLDSNFVLELNYKVQLYCSWNISRLLVLYQMNLRASRVFNIIFLKRYLCECIPRPRAECPFGSLLP